MVSDENHKKRNAKKGILIRDYLTTVRAFFRYDFDNLVQDDCTEEL